MAIFCFFVLRFDDGRREGLPPRSFLSGSVDEWSGRFLGVLPDAKRSPNRFSVYTGRFYAQRLAALQTLHGRSRCANRQPNFVRVTKAPDMAPG